MFEITLTFMDTLSLGLLFEAISVEGSTLFFEAMGLPPKIVQQPELLFTEARLLLEDYYEHCYDYSYLPAKYSRFADKNMTIFFQALSELYDVKTSQTFYEWANYNSIQKEPLGKELAIWYRFFLQVIRDLLNSKPNLLEGIADEAFIIETLSPLHPKNIQSLFADIQKRIQQTNSEWEQWLVGMKQRGIGDFDSFTNYDLIENARSYISNISTNNRVYRAWAKLAPVTNITQLERLARQEYPEFTEPFLLPGIDTKKFII